MLSDTIIIWELRATNGLPREKYVSLAADQASSEVDSLLVRKPSKDSLEMSLCLKEHRQFSVIHNDQGEKKNASSALNFK